MHNLPGAFILTGNFYENMILRKYVSYDKEEDVILMKRPIITADAERMPDLPIASYGTLH